MPVICVAAGILCLIYFIVLLLYSGFTSAFYLVWLLMSAGFLLLGWLFRIRFFQHLPLPVRTGILLFVSVCFLFFLGVEGMLLPYPEKLRIMSLSWALMCVLRDPAGRWPSGLTGHMSMPWKIQTPSSSSQAARAATNPVQKVPP